MESAQRTFIGHVDKPLQEDLVDQPVSSVRKWLARSYYAGTLREKPATYSKALLVKIIQ